MHHKKKNKSRNYRKVATIPKNGWWSRMIHKWWIIKHQEDKVPPDTQ